MISTSCKGKMPNEQYGRGIDSPIKSKEFFSAVTALKLDIGKWLIPQNADKAGTWDVAAMFEHGWKHPKPKALTASGRQGQGVGCNLTVKIPVHTLSLAVTLGASGEIQSKMASVFRKLNWETGESGLEWEG